MKKDEDDKKKPPDRPGGFKERLILGGRQEVELLLQDVHSG